MLLARLIKHFKCEVDFELLDSAIWATDNLPLLKILVTYYKVEDESEPKELTSTIIHGGKTNCLAYYLSEFPYLVKDDETVEEARNSLLAYKDTDRARLFIEAGWFDETIFDEIKLAERCGWSDLRRILLSKIEDEFKVKNWGYSPLKSFEYSIYDKDTWKVEGIAEPKGEKIPFSALIRMDEEGEAEIVRWECE